MSSATGALSIDLSAIQANWRLISTRLGADAAASAVIKANAYGLGASAVGPALYRAGCREFFVATPDEAVAAREYLPDDAVVYVLGGVRPGLEQEFIERRLTPVLFTLEAVVRWREALERTGATAPSALKVDTGMTRMGLSRTECRALLADPGLLRGAQPSLFMSHLACADEPAHPMNGTQLAEFRAYCAQVRALVPGVRCSLANSSGIFLGADWHFEQVRPGAALYGFNPQPTADNPMHPVVQLDLPVLQLRDVEGDVSVGYGASARLSSPARVAVVAGGYADGLHRTIGRQAEGEVMGRRVPTVGRISMDTAVFDVTGVPLPADADDLYVQVLNRDLTLNLAHERAGALGYEVLTSLGSGRYRRRYLGGAGS